jgi:hypothetical protein
MQIRKFKDLGTSHSEPKTMVNIDLSREEWSRFITLSNGLDTEGLYITIQ